jgi:glutaredoxin-like protein
MPLLSEQDRKDMQLRFEANLVNPVKLLVFTQEHECQFCRDVRELAESIAARSPKISIEIYDLLKNEKEADEHGVDKIPAIVLVGEKDYGVRYFGLPAGYEFTAFIEDIIDVSTGTTALSEDVKNKLKKVNKKVHIQVFVSPTCPYCPRAVRTAHMFAIENEHITADMVEISEFPYLTQRYSVMSVPRIVINEDTAFVGAHPEGYFIEQVFAAISSYNPMYS